MTTTESTEEIDRTIEIEIEGMTCSHCVASVTEELGELPSVKNVEIILRSDKPSTATVLTDTAIEDSALVEAVEEAGYKVTGIKRDF